MMETRSLEDLELELSKLLLAKKKAEIKLSALEKKENDKKRKARNHRIFQLGGLVEWVLGEAVDVEFLTGCLMGIAKIEKDSDKYLLYKNYGASFLDKYNKKNKLSNKKDRLDG